MRVIHVSFFILSMLELLSSCEKDSNYRFAGLEDAVGGSEEVDVSGYPVAGELAFHEDFSGWKRDGYVNLLKSDCELDQMSTSLVMYIPVRPVVMDYGGFSVSYTLRDYAVNPVCGVAGGVSGEISMGYVALQQLIFYECGQHDSDALLELSVLPSVSRIRFSVSLGGRLDDVVGITLWCRGSSESVFRKVGEYAPVDGSLGEVFEVELQMEDVILRFVPMLTGRAIPVNDGINRAVRLHDLWVWS